MRLPRSYDSITVKQYQVVSSILKKNIDFLEKDKQILSYFTGKDDDYFESIPIKKLQKLRRKINWVYKEDFNAKKRKYLILNKTVYKAVFEAKDLNTPQYIDIQSFLSRGDLVSELHNLLACIYLPLSKKGFRYDGSKHAEIASDFLNVKMGKVYPTVFFYTKVWLSSMNLILDYGVRKAQELNSHLSTEIQKLNLESIGDGK